MDRNKSLYQLRYSHLCIVVGSVPGSQLLIAVISGLMDLTYSHQVLSSCRFAFRGSIYINKDL